MKNSYKTGFYALLLTLALPFAAQATTLDYQVNVEGRKAGYMEVTVSVNENNYQIKGRMWTTGLARFLSRWWSKFTTSGRLENGRPVTAQHRMVEHSKRRDRDVQVDGGILRELKNGRHKKPRKILARTDVLSALFFAHDCDAPANLYNSKDSYQLVAVAAEQSADAMRCEYDVRDEDNQRFHATVWLNRIDGRNVPVRIDLSGGVKGSIRLRS